MAQYLVLIYDDEAALAAASGDDFARLMAGHQQFMGNNESALRGGNALQPTSTATSIRPDGGGGFTVTDAPFAETKEALSGYYLIEAADLDQAVAIAGQVPMFSSGVEVRPVRPLD